MMSDADAVYQRALMIDGLNVSHWESPAVYLSLKAGSVTAMNATTVVWEGFQPTMDNTAA